LLFATFKHMKKPYQLLVIPLTLWSGVEQGFFGADYTAGYVSCVLGVHNVGWVLITYGVCDAICSVSFGAVIKYTGRVPIFLLGAAINLVVVIIFFEWTPNADQAYVFYILAGMWGIADAVWQTQINGMESYM
jgi:predicted MFS family arabinose efflux permease